MNHEQFMELASLLSDGQLTADQMAQLKQYLRDHADARQELVERLFLDSMLTEELGKETVVGLVDMVGQRARE